MGTCEIFLLKWKWEEEMNGTRKYSRTGHSVACLHQGQSAHYLLEAQSNKNFLLFLRAAIGYTSFSMDCCSYCQEPWQRKHTSIKHCNAELADNTKTPTFSCAHSPFLSFFPAYYHNYAMESFL